MRSRTSKAAVRAGEMARVGDAGFNDLPTSQGGGRVSETQGPSTPLRFARDDSAWDLPEVLTGIRPIAADEIGSGHTLFAFELNFDQLQSGAEAAADK